MNNNYSTVRFSATRFSAALLLAMLITTVLFSQLYNLTTPSLEFVFKPTHPIDFKPARIDSQLVVKPRDVPKPVLLIPAQVPGVKGMDTETSPIEKNNFRTEKFIPGTIKAEPPSPMTSGSDHDALPSVRIDPVYPARAALLNQEGWVKVRFNVSGTGTVTDATVVASEPAGVFDKSALDAVQRWRYSPKVEGAVVVERSGLETILRFNLSDQ